MGLAVDGGINIHSVFRYSRLLTHTSVTMSAVPSEAPFVDGDALEIVQWELQ